MYEEVLFPEEGRAKVHEKPKHMQFMESLLVLSMLTPEASRDSFSDKQLKASLSDLSLDVDDEVLVALEAVINTDVGDKSYNLLHILRTHNEAHSEREQVSVLLRELYDGLYEEDLQEQQESGDQGEDEDGEAEGQFDYSDTSGCGHDHSDQSSENSSDNRSEITGGDDDSREEGDNTSGAEDAQDGSDAGQNTRIDFSEIASQIAESIEQSMTEKDEALQAVEEANETAKKAEQEKRRQQFQQELGLNDTDFNGYERDRQRYSVEISAFAQIISQLKRERSDYFLAPSQETQTRGHRINVGKLIGFLASGQQQGSPDIFKAPSLSEKAEFDFDGLDVFMLCDISDSMQGVKAKEAAAAFVVILEGLMQADEVASVEDLVQIQIQAFGSGNYTVAPLTAQPSIADLGRTYAKIANPNESTYVTESLIEAGGRISNEPHEPRRLQIVSVVSDGDFADSESAKREGQKIEDSGGIILQFIYGDASVSQLSEQARIIRLDNAASLPRELFELVPDLLEIIRSQHNA